SVSYQHTDFSIVKHVSHQVAARAGRLVYDHYFRYPDAGFRTGEGITIAGYIVKVAVKIPLQDVNDIVGCRASAVVALINDCAFLILLCEVITIEAGIAGLASVRQIDISKLAVRESLNQPAI